MDTGATISAMSLYEFKEIQSKCPYAILSTIPFPPITAKVASGKKTRVEYLVQLRFHLAMKEYVERFIIVKRLTHTLLGMPFYTRNKMIIMPAEGLLKSPTETIQLCYKVKGDLKKSDMVNPLESAAVSKKTMPQKKVIWLRTTQEVQLRPAEATTGSWKVVPCVIEKPELVQQFTTGVIEGYDQFEKKFKTCVASALTQSNEKYRTAVPIHNSGNRDIRIKAHTRVAKFYILTADQGNYVVPIDPKYAELCKDEKDLEAMYTWAKACRDSEYTASPAASLNALRISPEDQYNNLPEVEERDQSELTGPEPSFWFATPETHPDPSGLTDLEKDIWYEIQKLNDMEKLNPLRSEEDKEEYLKKFNLDDTVLTSEQLGLQKNS